MTPEPDEEEETAQTKPEISALQRQADQLIQMKSANPSQDQKAATADLESSVQTERGRGQPIKDSVRGQLEQGFGADFSGVRVHTDSKSDELNQSIQARAFTTGQDIFFRQGAYDTSSKQGQQLLAHELTHVVQQSGGAVQAKSEVNLVAKDSKIQRKASPGASSTRKPSPRQEKTDEKTELDKQSEPTQPTQKTDTAAAVGQPQPPADAAAGGNQPPAGEGAAKPPTVGGVAGNQPPTAGGEAAATPQATAAAGGGSDQAPTSPEEDPAFQAVVNATQELATQQQEHPPAIEKAEEAQAAAEPPANEVESKAQANQVGEMQQAETPEFDAAALKEKLMVRIADLAPKTLEEADEFENDNKLDSVKDELTDNVKQEQDASQGQLAEKAEETPDTSGIEPKSVAPLPQKDAEKSAKDTGAQKAAPKSKGRSEVETPLQKDSQKLDQQLAENKVTEEQLKKSNEPEFQAALKSKEQAHAHAEQAPPQYRQSEQDLIADAEATAITTAKEKTQEMQDARTQQFDEVRQQQVGAKGKDEHARTKIADDIHQIYENTKTKVDTILSELDAKVVEAFDAGRMRRKKPLRIMLASGW